MRDSHGKALDENPDYAAVMALGARVIAEAGKRKLDPDGYLGALKVIRSAFAFLEQEFGFALVHAHIDEATYASDTVALTLQVPVRHNSPDVWIKQVSDPGYGYMLEHVLFWAGMREPLMPFTGIQVRSRADVQAWFISLAALLRKHAGDLFADRPGAFDSLAAAAKEHERLFNEECERRYTEIHGHPHDGPRPDDLG